MIFFINFNKVLITRMFLINRIKLETVSDKNLLQRLKMWFNIAPNEYISNPTLLDPYTKKLNTFLYFLHPTFLHLFEVKKLDKRNSP